MSAQAAGAASGAMAGATAGMAFGPIGAGVGALAGGAMSFLGGSGEVEEPSPAEIEMARGRYRAETKRAAARSGSSFLLWATVAAVGLITVVVLLGGRS